MQNIIVCFLAVAASILVQSSNLLASRIILRRFIAAIILFLPPFFDLDTNSSLSYLKITETHLQATIGYAIFFSLVTIALNLKMGGRSENIKIYPQVRTREWSLMLFVLNALSWTIYLTAYEFLFRGYLFYSCQHFTSIENAFIIAIILYAVAHLYKTEQEFLLSVPFGALLCYITFVTDNVWAAVIIHIALAISNDIFAFRANPHFSMTSPFRKKLSL